MITNILKGIDRCEVDHTDGWWETETGALFGREKLVEAQGYECGLLQRITELESHLPLRVAHAANNEQRVIIAELKTQLEATNQRYLQVSAQTCRAEALQTQLADAQKDAWIPVSERLPENSDLVLLCGLQNGSHAIGTGSCHHGLIYHPVHIATSSVTHWMPLPQPPVMQLKEQSK